MEEIDQSYLDEIRRVRDLRLKRLDLSNSCFERKGYRRKLGKIPEEVFDLTWIEILDLSHNQLTTLPESITQFLAPLV